MLSLSEAILLGSTMIKPRRGTILLPYVSAFNGTVMITEEAGCALGMAYKAAGFFRNDSFDIPHLYIPHDSPIRATLNTRASLPCACSWESEMNDDKVMVKDIIAHIFDCHVILEDNEPVGTPWTLEQLVDWVRSVETEHADEQWAKHAQLTEEAVTV